MAADTSSPGSGTMETSGGDGAAALKELFVKKCSDMACPAPAAVLDDLSGPGPITSLKLNGNSKRLFNSRLTYMQVVALCEALYEDTSVVSLDLSYNNLNDMAAQALGRLIKVNSMLRHLNLCGNDITAAGAKALADALASDECKLQVLLLPGNPLEDEGVCLIGSALNTNRSLQALDLCNTRAGILGIITVCNALGSDPDADGGGAGAGHEGSGACCPLESLDLGRPILPGPQDTTVLAIGKMLATNGRLRHLALSKHGLSDSQLDTLATYGLLRNVGLASLDVHANKLSAFSGPTLERLLNDKRELTDLDLSFNPLGDGGALALARCLPYTPWLCRVDVRSCGIGDAGLAALAEALSLASHVTSLRVWGNAFGPAASRAFFDTLAAAGDARPTIDIKPYAVDGVAQVALADEAAE